MSVVKWHPVSEMLELGNLLQRSFDGNGYPRPKTGLNLSLDVYESETELVLTAALPGASREDLEIEYEDRLLTVFAHVPSGRRITYRRALFLQAQQLATSVRTGEVDYQPVSWR